MPPIPAEISLDLNIQNSSIPVLLKATVASCLYMHKGKKRYYDQDQLGHAQPAQRIVSSLNDAVAEAPNCFTLSEIEDATRKFEKKIGSLGFWSGVLWKNVRWNGNRVLDSNNSFEKKNYKIRF